jgi:hypothetical protein
MEEEKNSLGEKETEYYDEFEEYAPLPWVEKNGFAHWAVAFAWLVVGLIAFQLLASIIAVILILPTLTSDFSDRDAVMAAFEQNINLTLVANSIGQFFVIGLASYMLTNLHAIRGRRHQFLRLQITPKLLRITGVSVLLLVSSWGVVSLLGWLNYNIFEWLISVFPSLSFFKDLQTQMAEMITGFIKTENSMWLGLVYIALVPAIFEEIMFRGYIMRALEKSWGIWVAIIVSGIMFGGYHIQPSNFLPLSFLGILFAYVTYVSQSLYPAMLLHFINNGSQVVYGSMNPEFLENIEPNDVGMPWFLITMSVIITSGLLYLLYKMKTEAEV